MSAERLEILGMLRDQVISVEDAERLLKALGEGEEKRQERESANQEQRYDGNDVGGGQAHCSGSWGGKKWNWGSIGRSEVFREVVSSLGPTVKEVVQDALDGFGMEGLEDQDEVFVEDGRFVLPEGATLSLRSHKSHEGTKLKIVGIEGEHCELACKDGQSAEVYRQGEHYSIHWSHGTLELKIPNHIELLQAVSLGGSMSLKGVAAPMKLKTMGGNIKLKGLTNSFQARTMGGDIRVSLASEWQGEGKADTMGGTLTADIPEPITANISAETFGGSIFADEELGPVERVRTLVFERAKLSSEEATSKLAFKSAGGEIHLRR